MKRPEILEIRIEDLSRGGAGVARLPSGQVVFVPFSMPGDRVRAEITRTKKHYLMTRLVEVLEKAPERVEPPCPVFGRCGGCQWQHIPYELQWKTKVRSLEHEFTKRGWVIPTGGLAEIPATQHWEYRNRVQLHGAQGKLGFFAPGSSELIAVSRCEIARPEINVALGEVRTEAKKRFKGTPYKVELEVGVDSTQLYKAWNSPHAAQGFRQVHDEQNEKLRSWIAEQFTESGVVLDLYGGSGNFSELLLGRMESVHCVDVGAPRVPSPHSNLFFHRRSVLAWLTAFQGTADYAILDPPREGLGEDALDILAELERLHVKRVIAVGCDLDAWLKDLARWFEQGWKLRQVAAVDFFPQTTHLESVAVMERRIT